MSTSQFQGYHEPTKLAGYIMHWGYPRRQVMFFVLRSCFLVDLTPSIDLASEEPKPELRERLERREKTVSAELRTRTTISS